jgi:hypothetical protein
VRTVGQPPAGPSEAGVYGWPFLAQVVPPVTVSVPRRPGCQVRTAEVRCSPLRMPRLASDAQAPEDVAPRWGIGQPS